jgi:hypothetical protein
MPPLIARDDIQLRRLESAITRMEDRPAAEQRKMSCLLAALRRERAEILRYAARPPRARAQDPAVA